MRGGADYRLRDGHYRHVVFAEMIVQIVSDYGSLPDYRSLNWREISFFYNALRKSLHQATKSR